MADKEKLKIKAGKYVPWYIAGAAVIITIGTLLFFSLQPSTENRVDGAISVCGNDIIEVGEDCDGTLEKQTCTTIAGGFTGGILRCSSACAFDTRECTVAVTTPSADTCGNGVLNAEEECDDGNAKSGDGCSSNCMEEIGPSVCGSAAAVCEFGTSLVCTTSTGYGGVRNCKSDCSGYINCKTTNYCGDNILNGPEECDDGNSVNDDGCSNLCKLLEICTPSAEICDGIDNDCDGVVDEGNPGGGDACDTGNLGVCSSGTFTCSGGTLDCQQNILPSEEICDGLDNDCDGTVDEECTSIEVYFIICSTGPPRTCSSPNEDNYAEPGEEVEFHWDASDAPEGSTVTGKILYTIGDGVLVEESGLPIVGQTTFLTFDGDGGRETVYAVFIVLNSAGVELTREETEDISISVDT